MRYTTVLKVIKILTFFRLQGVNALLMGGIKIEFAIHGAVNMDTKITATKEKNVHGEKNGQIKPKEAKQIEQ
jgi:hypothetical protein